MTATTWSALDAVQSVLDGALLTARLTALGTEYGVTLPEIRTWGRGANFTLPEGAASPAVRLFVVGHAETDLVVGGGDRVLEIGIEIGLGSREIGTGDRDALPGAIGLYAEAIRLALIDDLMLGRVGSTLKSTAGIYDVLALTVSHDYIPGFDPTTRANWMRAQLRTQVRQRIPTR